MVQIAKRKRGRPSKADLARRAGESPAVAVEPDNQQRLRRRNVRYNIINYDGDYVDDEQDERKREKKKLKLMAKLNQGEEHEENESTTTGIGLREEECDEIEGAEDNNDAEEDDMTESLERETNKSTVKTTIHRVKGRKVDTKGLHGVSVAGNLADPSSGIPLPDKKSLELILDKLQKKDTYGVYSEPVDPEELPDYHDVIDNPMDFSTVRKKLANGYYHTLEQFESDIFLICSNAMQYNAPETVYHKQARTIQELGRKKFEKLRSKCVQLEQKSEQKTPSNSLVKKLVKKPPGSASQEPVGFDFYSGASIGTIGNVQKISHPMRGGSCEMSGNIDGMVEANAFLVDANQDKAEDIFSGKFMRSKLGMKSFVLDKNRRSSYNMSSQPITRSDSTLMTFESGVRQLVTIGVHTEYSYTRSLARFSASLGPVAWKIASHKIQEALPAGCKFGRGWVGEYEPLPTPIVMLGSHLPKETSLFMKLHSIVELQTGDKTCKDVEPSSEFPVHGTMLEGKHSSNCPASGPASKGNPMVGSDGVRPSSPLNVLNQNQNTQTMNFGKSENKGLEKVDLDSLPSSIQNCFSRVAKLTDNTSSAESKPKEMVARNFNALPSIPFMQSDSNRVSGEFPDGKVTNMSLNRRVSGPSSESTSNKTSRADPFVVHGKEQGLRDPVQSTRIFAEEAQKQQPSNHSPVGSRPVMPSAPSGQRDDSGNASAAAAHAWMSSIGEAGFKQGPDNSSREFHQHVSRIRGEFPSAGMSFQSDRNNLPFEAAVPQPGHTGAISQLPNPPTVFPQGASADQPRFQMQSPWRGLSPHSQSQPRQKQETLPPDLNIDCQSPGSPAKQSSSVVVDSQHPDLALQL